MFYYVLFNNGMVIFGLEIKVFKVYLDFDRVFDYIVVEDYLIFGYVFDLKCIY